MTVRHRVAGEESSQSGRPRVRTGGVGTPPWYSSHVYPTGVRVKSQKVVLVGR